MLVLLGAGDEAEEHPSSALPAGASLQQPPGIYCTDTTAAKESVQHTGLSVPCSFVLLPGWAGPVWSSQAPFVSSRLTSGVRVPLEAKYLLVLYTLCGSPGPAPRCLSCSPEIVRFGCPFYRHNHRPILHSCWAHSVGPRKLRGVWFLVPHGHALWVACA